VWKNRFQKFLDNPMAIWPFLKKRLYYNFIADRQLPYYKDFKFLNYEDTLNNIIDYNKSIVRFGDELFDMLQGVGLYYGNWHQKYDPKLASRMKEIISSRDPKLLICFNPEFILKTKEDFKREGIKEQWHFWTNSKIFLKDYYHKDIVYGSALCFTPRYNKNIDWEKIKKYFLTKNIIIVTSNTQRFKDIKLGTTTDFVEAPSSDAWQMYDGIKNDLLSLIINKNFNPENLLILISMGSAAKVLVYDLTKLGYTAWDTGQFFDLAAKEIENLSTAN
jgi:hypothetical protein